MAEKVDKIKVVFNTLKGLRTYLALRNRVGTLV